MLRRRTMLPSPKDPSNRSKATLPTAFCNGSNTLPSLLLSLLSVSSLQITLFVSFLLVFQGSMSWASFCPLTSSLSVFEPVTTGGTRTPTAPSRVETIRVGLAVPLHVAEPRLLRACRIEDALRALVSYRRIFM